MKKRLRLAMKSFATSLALLAIISVGGNTLASLYRRSHLPSWEELAVPALIALLGAIAITVFEQLPLWRDRIPQSRR